MVPALIKAYPRSVAGRASSALISDDSIRLVALLSPVWRMSD